MTPTERMAEEEAAIRSLENSFVAAFHAGDLDAMMAHYVSDESLVVFDVVPRKQAYGARAYRQAWADFFSHFSGQPTLVISDLGITVQGELGFSHSLQHITGMDVQGRPVDRTVRVTDGYRKVRGKWLIAQEHISLPVDLRTGKVAQNDSFYD
jgi:ketosteroid isomerase-like protein